MIGFIIQARLSSQRFPGKVLHEVEGKPLIAYLLESLERCRGDHQVVLATSDEKSDDPLAAYCSRVGVPFYRGPLENVALRFKRVIEKFGFKSFGRLCGDSPLLDHRIVERAVEIHNTGEYDLVTNVAIRTFPKGQSVEIVDSSFFIRTYPLMTTRAHQEHVTRLFYERHLKARMHNFKSDSDFSQAQLAVDTPEDMQRFKNIVKNLEKPHWAYPFEEYLI